MKRLPCQRCRSYTNQKRLYAKLRRPQRWEEIFSVCRSCADLGRDPLCHIFREVYSIVDSPRFDRFICPADTDGLYNKVGSILEKISSTSSLPTFDRIAFNLRREGFGIGSYRLRELLTAMESNGLVACVKIDYTEQLLRRFSSHGKAGRECPACGRLSFISLFSEFADEVSSVKKQNVHMKVGGYCMRCGASRIDIRLALANNQL